MRQKPSLPFVLEDGEQNGVADVAGPGDSVPAQHAFTDGAELLHRRLAAPVALVDAELDAANPAIKGPREHHVLDPAIEPGAAQVRTVKGAADLQRTAIFVDAKVARHAGEFVAVEQYEGAVALAAAIEVDALVEAVGAEIERIDLPDVAVL